MSFLGLTFVRVKSTKRESSRATNINLFGYSKKNIRRSGSSVLRPGDFLAVVDGSIVHAYSAAGGPQGWSFGMMGETFLVIQLLVEQSSDPPGWSSALALASDGIIVVISYPTNGHTLHIV